MSIDLIDGNRLRDAVIAAAQRILEVQDRLNRINVFPVADGDTGTNMALTMRSVAEAAMNAGEQPLHVMGETLADAALMGARGNSGAILAQFFQGLSDGFKDHERVGLKGFIEGISLAVTYAEEAIAEPAPGTILSVMQAWSGFIDGQVERQTTIDRVFAQALDVAMSALQKTPDQLPVLKEAGVVDAGAQGFVNMLEGVMHLIKTGSVLWTGIASDQSAQAEAQVTESVQDIHYQFCTEALIEDVSVETRTVRNAIAAMGDSLIVAGSPKKLKIHIHTNEPQALFDTLAGFGRLVKTKAEDMREQHNHHQQRHQIALIMDSSCDLPADYAIHHQIRVVPVQVTFDGVTYADRLDITAEEVYRKMAAGAHPSTSQPSPAAFHQALNYACEHYDKAILITVSGGLSGTFQAAQLAAKHFADRIDTRVIDSRAVAGAAGLLVQRAASYIAAGLSLDEIETKLLQDRERIEVFVSFPSLETLKRGGRVNIIQGFFARLLNIVPIIGLKKNGRVKSVAKTRPGLASWKTLVDLVKRRRDAGHKLHLVLCHAHAPEGLATIQAGLAELGYVDLDVMEVSPTIVAQVGLGAVAVCLYREESV